MFTWAKRLATRWFNTSTYGGRIDATGRPAISARTHSGIVVDERTAMTIPAFLHGVRLYASTLGSLDWDLIQETDAGRVIARTHPIHRLLHDEPNEYQLAASWRETMLLNAIVHGNAYSFIERNGNFRPSAMLILPPDQTSPIRANGELSYVTHVNGQPRTLDPYQIYHLPGLSSNGLTGIPLVKVMAETLGLTKAEESFASAFFGNGCNMGGFLESPNKLKDDARKNLTNSMNEQHGGVANAHKWSLLEEGITAKHNDINAEEMQLVASRQFQLGDMARILGLSPHLLFDLSRATFSNIEHLGIEAVTYSFKPWANKLCSEANRKLLYESEKGIYEACLDLKPLMQGDAKTQAERDQLRFNCAAMTPNEMRVADGRNPIEGGDQLFVNAATLPLDLIVKRTLAEIAAKDAKAASLAPTVGVDNSPALVNDDAPPESDKDIPSDGPAVDADMVEDANVLSPRCHVLRPVVVDTVGRLMRREVKAVRAAYGKHGESPDALGRWLSAYGPETRQVVAQALQPVAQSVVALGLRGLDVGELADAFAKETAADLLKARNADDLDLMAEGWQGDRAERLVDSILGKTNETN